MNILDENIIERQCQRLRTQRIRVRHIGHDIGHKGITDEEIIPFLHQLRRPTFFRVTEGSTIDASAMQIIAWSTWKSPRTG